MFLFWLIISFAVLAIGSAFSVRSIRRRRQSMLKPLEVFSVTVFSAGTLMFVPFYAAEFAEDEGVARAVKTFLLSLHNAIRLFVVDGDFEIVKNGLAGQEPLLRGVFSVFAAIVFVLAPVIAFGAVLSVIMSAFVYQRYLLSFGSHIYIFSELNAKSIALAKSIYSKDMKVKLVFNDVFDKNDEESSELIAEAKSIGAVMFKKDITAVNYAAHKKNKPISFFLIGEDDTENIAQTMYLLDAYRNRKNTDIYLFSTSLESELLCSSIDRGEVHLRRINDVESLIFRTLYEKGESLFDNADTSEEPKRITAVIIGMGRYGTEMVKTLSWFCQMDGYFTEIHAFDARENCESEFRSLCPELMDPRFNRFEMTDDDARYQIRIEGGVDVFSNEFDEKIKALSKATYVFVALGSDERNIQVAAKLRRLFEGIGAHPQIQSVVYNSKKKHTLNGVTNFKGQALDMEFIGDIATSYSESVVLGSDVENLALARHLKWGDEKDFWSYEYNYRSSIASVIHKKMKIHCGIPGADRPVEARTQAEKEQLRRLEHRRWNAYMRSEGYTYAEKRNDLARQHPDLKPFSELPPEEQAKDDN